MPCALLREHAVRYPGGGTLAALTAWVALLDLARGVRRSAAERRRARRARRNAPQIVPLSRVASTLSSLGTVSAHSSLARLADCTDSGNDESFHSSEGDGCEADSAGTGNLGADECPVCFAVLGEAQCGVAVYGRCGHLLCGKCALRWASHSGTCPICRQKSAV